MADVSTPRWLQSLERKLAWLAIPNIAILLVTLQGLGFLLTLSDSLWLSRLALVPERVLEGEYWRLITFLSIPLSMSPIWMLFAAWFLYFIVNAIENEWGAFKTTLYVLTSVLLTISFSFLTGYPVASVAGFESSLFLAAATLFPDMQILLFMIAPVKLKWLGWVTGALVLYKFALGDWLERMYLAVIYANYLIFFGPAGMERIRQARRRRRFRSSFRS